MIERDRPLLHLAHLLFVLGVLARKLRVLTPQRFLLVMQCLDRSECHAIFIDEGDVTLVFPMPKAA